ncbi:MAG: hypothetical protein EXS51_04545 [Candidatus Taylorbacteria bacterium]|nr:hypothetical protein [Candidatus Taylorbacteria bacterium]
MKKQTSAVVSISFVKRFLLFFGITRWLTRNEASFLFKNAKHPVPLGIEGWLMARVRIYCCTRNWEKVFYHGLLLANSEELVKDFFFSAATVTYGIGKEHPLQNAAAEKWLTFLADAFNEYHRKMVWGLASHNDIWIYAGTQGNVLARERRQEFATTMMQGAVTAYEMQLAAYYAIDGSPVQMEAWQRSQEMTPA